MARSKQGGSRGLVRGKLGSTIFQVKRSADGKAMQIQKAAEESRVNNNTEAQAKARMVMGMIQRMFHALPDIIKDAYKSTPRGTLSFQHFAKINYPLLKADRDDHWSGGCEFDWREKGDMTPPAGIWKLADGSYHNFLWDTIDIERVTSNQVTFIWYNFPETATFADFLTRCNLDRSDQLFLIYFFQKKPDYVPEVRVSRYRINPAIPLNVTRDNFVWEEILLPIDDDAPQVMGLNMGNGDIYLTFSNFYDDVYVVANAAIMVVNYTKQPMKFSSAQFEWFIRIDQTVGAYWYGIRSPKQVWPSWFESTPISDDYDIKDYLYADGNGTFSLPFGFEPTRQALKVRFKAGKNAVMTIVGSATQAPKWFHLRHNQGGNGFMFEIANNNQIVLACQTQNMADLNEHELLWTGANAVQEIYWDTERVARYSLGNELPDVTVAPVQLFGDPYHLFEGRLYEFTVINNETQDYICDLVPAIRKSDDMAGLLDTVTNEFYGSTHFSCFDE